MKQRIKISKLRIQQRSLITVKKIPHMSIPFVSEKSKNLIVTKQQYTARQQKDKRKNNHSKNRDQRFQFPTAFSNTHTTTNAE